MNFVDSFEAEKLPQLRHRNLAKLTELLIDEAAV